MAKFAREASGRAEKGFVEVPVGGAHRQDSTVITYVTATSTWEDWQCACRLLPVRPAGLYGSRRELPVQQADDVPAW